MAAQVHLTSRSDDTTALHDATVLDDTIRTITLASAAVLRTLSSNASNDSEPGGLLPTVSSSSMLLKIIARVTLNPNAVRINHDVRVSSVRDAPPIPADLVLSTTLNDGWETTDYDVPRFIDEPELQLLPLVINSSTDMMLPILESALSQRKELGISIPVAVVCVVSDCDTRVQVCVRSSDSESGSYIASTEKSNISPEFEVFNLADNDSALSFSALIVQICSRASALADAGSTSPRSVSPVSQDGVRDEPSPSRVILWRNAISPPAGLVRHQSDGDASDHGREPVENTPIPGCTSGVSGSELIHHDTPDSNKDEDQRLAGKPRSRLLRFTTGGHRRLYNGTTSLTSWRIGRRVWLMFRAEPSYSADQWLLDYSKLYDELIQLPHFEELGRNVYSMDVPPFLAGTLDVLRDQYNRMPSTPPDEISQSILKPLASHINFLLSLSYDIPHPASAMYTQEAYFRWYLLMQRMYVDCDGQDTSRGWICLSGMLNLPQNDTALANIGTAPDWYNTYDPKTMDYVWFIRDQRAQVGYRRNYDNPRLRWASHVAEEAATRATKSLRDLNFEYNRFQSLLEKQQGMLLDACQEPVEVPYDLLLSIPVDTAGMDDVVRNRMMCHFRTLTTESPTDDSNLTPSLPTLIVRHTKPGEDTRQAHNECMMSLVPVVKFMAAVALKDQPVFGLIIRGSVGKLILAWMNTDTDEKYDGLVCVLTRNVSTFDLAEPVDVLRFSAFLQRLRKYHEDRLEGIQGRIREFFETHDDGESLDWTAKAHTDKIRDALAASGFELTQDEETGLSFGDRSQYIRDIDDLSEVELDEARENHVEKCWWFIPTPKFYDETTDDDDSEESESDGSEDVDASSENENGSVDDDDSENENGSMDGTDNSYEDSDQDQGDSDEDCGSQSTVATESEQDNEDSE